MADRRDVVHVRLARDGGYYWRRCDGHNGEEKSRSSETYVRRSHALDQAIRMNPDCDVIFDSPGADNGP